MEQNLKGKTAIVTGSTSGIGLAIAKELLARGANVMFNGVFGADAKGQAQQAEFEATLAALRAAHLSQQMFSVSSCAMDALNRR